MLWQKVWRPSRPPHSTSECQLVSWELLPYDFSIDWFQGLGSPEEPVGEASSRARLSICALIASRR